MKQERQLELFRAVVKSKFREKGLRFDRNVNLRDIGREVKKFNEESKLSTPVTTQEFCEIYEEFMNELIAEHQTLMRTLSSSSKDQQLPKIQKPILGPAFTSTPPIPGTSDHEE